MVFLAKMPKFSFYYYIMKIGTLYNLLLNFLYKSAKHLDTF